jgi:hypothetical protein
VQAQAEAKAAAEGGKEVGRDPAQRQLSITALAWNSHFAPLLDDLALLIKSSILSNSAAFRFFSAPGKQQLMSSLVSFSQANSLFGVLQLLQQLERDGGAASDNDTEAATAAATGAAEVEEWELAAEAAAQTKAAATAADLEVAGSESNAAGKKLAAGAEGAGPSSLCKVPSEGTAHTPPSSTGATGISRDTRNWRLGFQQFVARELFLPRLLLIIMEMASIR